MSDNVKHRDEVYIPSVFTRLVDEEDLPLHKLSDFENLKREILENISLLLNSRSRPEQWDLDYDPYIYYSVLGFGVKDFCGRNHGENSLNEITENIRQQLIHFEPRLAPESIEIFTDPEQDMSHNEVEIEIRARISVKPFEEELKCIFALDLETGTPKLREEK